MTRIWLTVWRCMLFQFCVECTLASYKECLYRMRRKKRSWVLHGSAKIEFCSIDFTRSKVSDFEEMSQIRRGSHSIIQQSQQRRKHEGKWKISCYFGDYIAPNCESGALQTFFPSIRQILLTLLYPCSFSNRLYSIMSSLNVNKNNEYICWLPQEPGTTSDPPELRQILSPLWKWSHFHHF